MEKDPREPERMADTLAEELSSPAQYVGDNLNFLADAFEGFQQALDGYRSLFDELAPGATPPGFLDRARDLTKSLDLEFLRREVPLALRESKLGMAAIGSLLAQRKRLAQKG